ncbi:hypothetical protein CTAYLR_004972 [Chrysophaeum taylorii]|uniref:ALA-interacting subunit n=1 Tax=Chrysophaeum taylorii TaxID=2483200 RepID=A0AAD7UQI1_9STRA|nr:hypothetical protein CTAYLR_004972 [Chrysophaeum taylorii]
MASSSSSRRVRTDKWSQQSVPALRPLITSQLAAACLFGAGSMALMVGTVVKLVHNDEVFQRKIQYDNKDECKISRANEGRVCNVTIRAKHRMASPVYVYYELENFYQNHERYTVSYNEYQLLGRNKKKSALSSCSPLKKNGSRVLSPCGLIANSLFNDVLVSDVPMREDGISWWTDLHNKFKQPNKFEWAETNQDVSSCYKSFCPDSYCEDVGVRTPCKGYVCVGGDYDAGKCDAGQNVVFYYRKPLYYQFLYETFPEVVSPIVGVKNEHFIVWMRLAGLSTFRKLYGRLTSSVSKNEDVTFTITNNFNVDANSGKKFIVISTASTLGLNPKAIWLTCLGFGASSIFFALLLATKLRLAPRKLGDTSYLHIE